MKPKFNHFALLIIVETEFTLTVLLWHHKNTSG